MNSLLVLALFWAVLQAAPPKSADRQIVKLGDFVTVKGYFSQSDNAFDLYSAAAQPKTYTHDHYEFAAGSWKKGAHDQTGKPSQYLDVNPCDYLNQIDVVEAYPDLQKFLPGARIKDYQDVAPTTAVAFYSVDLNKQETQVRVAIGRADNGVMQEISGTEAVGKGNYCGYRWVPVAKNEDHQALLFVYSDEVRDRQVALVIYTYLLKF